jgi:hypothetical protein
MALSEIERKRCQKEIEAFMGVADHLLTLGMSSTLDVELTGKVSRFSKSGSSSVTPL